MAQLNIKTREAYELASEIARETGLSLSAAVTEALREKRERMRKPDERALIEKWMRIGRDTRNRLKEPWKSIEHGDLLYDDELGLPK